MTVARGMLVLCLMVTIAVAIVLVRAESAKCANRVQRLHHTQTALTQKLWSLEMELAHLRGPDEIRRRADSLGLNVVPPVTGSKPARPGGRIND